MSFTNEIISESDVQAYALDDLKRQWDQWAWRDGRPAGHVHDWVIDRPNKVFLLPIKQLEEVGPSGRPEPSRSSLWFLNWKGQWLKVILKRSQDSSTAFSDTPFRIDWELVEFDTSALPPSGRGEVIETLKEALQAYGHRGALKQIPGTTVRFNF